jgi:imidazolonepropionase-like amidohydrolase
MDAVRAPHCFDGTRFMPGGATLLVDDGLVAGVEPFAFDVPDGCEVTTYDGTLLPGLVDMHVHLVTDSGPNALERVAGRSDHELDAVVTEGLRRQLAAGVTTVRDLGDRGYVVVDRRDRQRSSADVEPRIVAFGPPVTTPGGHCDYLGGVLSGAGQVAGAIRERVEHGVDEVKVMASGGVNTPGTDVLRTQFSDDELRALVDAAHAAGLPVTAHAHGTPSVRQSLAAGVDGIEHCSCVTERGFGDADDALVAELGRSGVAICPTLGVDTARMTAAPTAIAATAERFGTTLEQLAAVRGAFVARLHRAGARIVSGVDAGIQPAKGHGTLPFAVVALVEAGLSVEDALASATSLAASACGLGGTTGRLAVGRDADVVVVEGDLSQDVRALHRPVSVRRAGREALGTR